MIDFCDDNTPKYQKKKNQKSKSSKRSNHKHQYEKLIVKGIIGWTWAKQCSICGRISCRLALSTREFQKPEYRQLPYISQQSYYTYEELQKLYPNVKILNKTYWELEEE